MPLFRGCQSGIGLKRAALAAAALVPLLSACASDRPLFAALSTTASLPTGSIRDQMGDTTTARRLHAQAAAAMPGDPTILSNYGMSYVLTGELRQAETLLAKAAALPEADGRVRQNLALVVGLEGRFDEAQKI